VPVLLTPDSKLMPPYPTAKISQDFTLIGLRVKQILPVATATIGSTVSAPVSPASSAPSASLQTVPLQTVPLQTAVSDEPTVPSSPAITTKTEEEQEAHSSKISIEAPSSKATGSPLISIAIPAPPDLTIQSSVQSSGAAIQAQAQAQPEPTIIHSLTELIPPEVQWVPAVSTIPQASDTVVTVNAPARDSLDVTTLSSSPALEPAEPHVRNTVVRISTEIL